MSDSIGPASATVTPPPTQLPTDCTNRCARDVRRRAGHLVAEELHDLVTSLTGGHDGGHIHPVLAELVQETARSVDHFVRQGRVPRRADLYSFRALAALAAAAGYHEAELVAVAEATADAVHDLWLTHARNLGELHGPPAVEQTAELVSEVTRLFLRKLPGQLAIGLALAIVTHQRTVAA